MSSLRKKLLDEENLVQSKPQTLQKKPGWKAMPYILGTSLNINNLLCLKC